MNGHPNPGTALQVTLDGAVVNLRDHQAGSLAAIRGRLEMLALEKQRLLFSLAVDGMPVSLARPLVDLATARTVMARTIGFGQLGFQLITVAEEQVEQLVQRTEDLALLTLINSWPKGQDLWLRLLPDLKEPLLTLSFIPQPVAMLPGGNLIAGEILQRRTVELSAILGRLESVSARGDAEEFSNALETGLLGWLQDLRSALNAFNSPDDTE